MKTSIEEFYAKEQTKSNPQWDGTERRRDWDDAVLELLKDNNKQLRELYQSHSTYVMLLNDHIKSEEIAIKNFLEAFPDADPGAHREYHELVMKSLQRREKWRDAVIEKSLSGLVWAAIISIGSAVWHSIKDHIRI